MTKRKGQKVHREKFFCYGSNENRERITIPYYQEEKLNKWVRDNVIKSSETNYKHTSRGLSDYASYDLDFYVSNADVKKAMYEAGFEPINPDAENWLFKIDESSPAFTKKRDML